MFSLFCWCTSGNSIWWYFGYFYPGCIKSRDMISCRNIIPPILILTVWCHSLFSILYLAPCFWLIGIKMWFIDVMILIAFEREFYKLLADTGKINTCSYWNFVCTFRSLQFSCFFIFVGTWIFFHRKNSLKINFCLR
jgi:hypothetical protein